MNIETPNRVKLDDCLRLVHQFPWLPAGIFAGTELMPNVKPRVSPIEPAIETGRSALGKTEATVNHALETAAAIANHEHDLEIPAQVG